MKQFLGPNPIKIKWKRVFTQHVTFSLTMKGTYMCVFAYIEKREGK